MEQGKYKSEKTISQHRANKRRAQKRKRSCMLFLLVFVAFLGTFLGVKSKKHPVIVIKVEARDIMLGDEIPSLKVEVLGTDITDKKLEMTGYEELTIKKLYSEIQKGNLYTMKQTATKTSLEGTYPVRIHLDLELQKKLSTDWKRKLKIKIIEGKVTIKNPVGCWKGDRFQRYDKSYVKNEFVIYKNKKYYFDEDGKKVTGVYQIDGTNYYFDKKAVMQTGWKKIEEKNCYFLAGGEGARGFLNIDESTYYFDKSSAMITGDMKIGTILCKFDKEGKLVSTKVTDLDPSKPMIALTFDDGPGERTMELLGILEQYKAKATFFMLGNRIGGNEATLKQMAKLGCELGNHSYDHPQLTDLPIPDIKNQIGTTSQLIAKGSGKDGPTLVRPPYGAVSDEVKANVPYPLILWDVDTLDWKTKNVQATIDSVLGNAKDGRVVLLHDIHGTTVDAAKEFIPKLIEEGYQLVTVSELAAAKGIPLVQGETYASFVQ